MTDTDTAIVCGRPDRPIRGRTVPLPSGTDLQTETITNFRNFLSWGEQPSHADLLLPADAPRHERSARAVPPAWWAYVLGYTEHCPYEGTW